MNSFSIKNFLAESYQAIGKDDQFIQQVLDCNDTKQFVDYIGELVDDYEDWFKASKDIFVDESILRRLRAYYQILGTANERACEDGDVPYSMDDSSLWVSGHIPREFLPFNLFSAFDMCTYIALVQEDDYMQPLDDYYVHWLHLLYCDLDSSHFRPDIKLDRSWATPEGTMEMLRECIEDVVTQAELSDENGRSWQDRCGDPDDPFLEECITTCNNAINEVELILDKCPSDITRGENMKAHRKKLIAFETIRNTAWEVASLCNRKKFADGRMFHPHCINGMYQYVLHCTKTRPLLGERHANKVKKAFHRIASMVKLSWVSAR